MIKVLRIGDSPYLSKIKDVLNLSEGSEKFWRKITVVAFDV